MLSELKPLIKVFARPGLPGFYLVNEWLKAKEQWRDLPQIRLRLLPQVEFLDQVFIPVGLRFAQVIEQTPALGYHFEEATTRGMIFGIGLQVFGQLLDSAREKCDLHVCTAGVFIVKLELLEAHCTAAFCHNEGGL
jgi:hypothetical protein